MLPGTRLVLEGDIAVAVLPQTAVLLVGIFAGQVVSAAAAARYTGGMERAGSIMMGFGMLGRAERAFVVINIACVQHATLSTEALYMLMYTILWLNVLAAVTIRFWKPCNLRSLEPAGSA